MISLIH